MIKLKDKYEEEVNETIESLIENIKKLENIKNLNESLVGKEYKFNTMNNINEQISMDRENLMRIIKYIAKDEYLNISFIS